MTAYLVVTITSPDKPGIIERLSQAISEFGANWEESRLARLGGDFAGIVKLSVPDPQAEALAAALRLLANEEMAISVKVSRPVAADPFAGYQSARLQLRGADHEGIVHEVARTLAAEGINVDNMETELVHAPISGSPLFQMEAELRVPPELALPRLHQQLRELGQRLGVDIDLFPL